MFNALVLEKTPDFRAEVREVDDALLGNGDVTIAVDYSTLNYKDALAILNRSPIVRTWPLVAGNLIAAAIGLVLGQLVPMPVLAAALAVGYVEQFGWVRARYAYAQLVFNLFQRVRVLSRTSWFHQITGGLLAQELGESLNLDVTIFRWLWVRASLSGRAQLDTANDPGAPKAAGVLSFQVGGQY